MGIGFKLKISGAMFNIVVGRGSGFFDRTSAIDLSCGVLASANGSFGGRTSGSVLLYLHVLLGTNLWAGVSGGRGSRQVSFLGSLSGPNLRKLAARPLIPQTSRTQSRVLPRFACCGEYIHLQELRISGKYPPNRPHSRPGPGFQHRLSSLRPLFSKSQALSSQSASGHGLSFRNFLFFDRN